MIHRSIQETKIIHHYLAFNRVDDIETGTPTIKMWAAFLLLTLSMSCQENIPFPESVENGPLETKTTNDTLVSTKHQLTSDLWDKLLACDPETALPTLDDELENMSSDQIELAWLTCCNTEARKRFLGRLMRWEEDRSEILIGKLNHIVENYDEIVMEIREAANKRRALREDEDDKRETEPLSHTDRIEE